MVNTEIKSAMFEKEGMEMDLDKVRERWINYNREIIDKFFEHLSQEGKISKKKEENYRKKINFFATDFLLDFESEMDEDPDNEDDGIITIDTVTAGYIDGFLGRWFIQKTDKASEKSIKEYLEVLGKFYEFLRANKLYKEGAAQYNKLKRRLANKKKYLKRLKSYEEIQAEKDDEEKYLDLMRDWEYEDLY